MTPSEKKAKVVNCIRKFMNDNGYPPSIREICALTSVGSPSTVNSYVTQLIGEGILKRNGNQRRCVIPADLIKKQDPIPKSECRRVCLKTADGGAVELDYSITLDARCRPQCTFEGILDCSRIKNPVSRIVSCQTEE